MKDTEVRMEDSQFLKQEKVQPTELAWALAPATPSPTQRAQDTVKAISSRSKGGWLLGQGLLVSVPLPVPPSTWAAAMMRRTWDRVAFAPMLPWSPHRWACGIPHRYWRRTCQSTSGSSGGHPSPRISFPAGGPCSSGNQTSQPWCPPCTWRDLRGANRKNK